MLSLAPPAPRRGLSIVEFMVGVVVGLFVVGGAAKLFVDYLSSNRKGMLETRVNQDLRAAADLVARDLRRAGYWRNATTGLYLGTVAPAASNPYAQVNYDAGANSLTYRYAKDGNDALDAATEEFGVKADGALRLLVGGGWQAITDPAIMTINSTDLQIPLVAERAVDLYTACPCFARSSCTENSFKNPDPDKSPAAPGDNWANRPRVIVREYELRITARSTVAQSTGAEVVREVRERVRPRNDVALGQCPA
jgi:prepilin peptidase dependent protein B